MKEFEEYLREEIKKYEDLIGQGYADSLLWWIQSQMEC